MGYLHSYNYEEFELLVEEMKASGANIILGPIENTHNNGMTFKNLYIQDPDGISSILAISVTITNHRERQI